MIIKKTFTAFALVLVLSSAAISNAAETSRPAAGAVAVDVVLVRPLGFASLVLGAGLFIVGLPFTLPSRSAGSAAGSLIADPFRFTFLRPIGVVEERGAGY